MGQELKVGERPVDDTKAFAFREPLGYFEQRNEIIYLRFEKGHAVRNRLWNGKCGSTETPTDTPAAIQVKVDGWSKW